MVQHVRPATKTQTKVLVVPREGELEITLNINISVDGQVTASSEDAEVSYLGEDVEEEDVEQFIPELTTGLKLNFGKEEG